MTFGILTPASARILLFEAGPRILPTYSENLSIKAQRHLERLGVEIHTNARVTGVDSEGIVVGGQRIPAAVLWGTGVVASSVGRWLGAETDGLGKVIVQPDLSVPGHAEVFVIGDTAHVAAPARNLFGIKLKNPMVMPGVAQPAIQQGRYAADVVLRRVEGRAQPEPFWYWDKGEFAIVGRVYAVADLRFAQFAGFLAWLVWAGVHIYFLIGFANRLVRRTAMGLCFPHKTSPRARTSRGTCIWAEGDRSNSVIFAKASYLQVADHCYCVDDGAIRKLVSVGDNRRGC
jgi:NADH:ubiquinone reductase (H+-translocating)